MSRLSFLGDQNLQNNFIITLTNNMSKRVCILGGGIAGLAFAFRLEQLIKLPKLTIFEKEKNVGGRLLTIRQGDSVCDVGANYITWDTLRRPEPTELFIRELLAENYVEIRKPLYLFDKQNGLKIGDHQSAKISDRRGLQSLAVALEKRIKAQIRKDQEVVKAYRENDKWKICTTKQVFQFEILIVAAPIPSVASLLSSEYKENESKIKYTRQLSVSFEQSKPTPYSCILFRNHPITFVCCQEEKCASQTVCIQFDPQFSEQHWLDDQIKLSKAVESIIPLQIDLRIGKIQSLNRWYPSLLESSDNLNDIPQKQLYFIGDSTLKKSRVAASLETGLIKAEELAALLK